MSKIRVTHSGLIALIVNLITVLTGILFTILITRKLSPDEFGIWSLIGTLVNYFLISQPIISFWTTREIARGEDVGRTAFISSLMFSIGMIPAYLALIHLVYQNNTYLNSMILATFLIPLSFIGTVLESINLGFRPTSNSYSLILFESLKIPVGLILVLFFNLGVIGAVLTTIIAFSAKILLHLYLGRTILRGKFLTKDLLRWIKLSWLPIYNRISGILFSLDVFIYSIITHSFIGVAYYAASMSISNIINNAGQVSQALYPKLLSKGSQELIKTNLRYVFYFGILFVTISINFSKPGLFVLNPAYSDIYIISIIIALRTFFYVITTNLYQILLGLETVDVEKTYEFSKIVKSKLFIVPTIQLFHYGSYIVTISITVSILFSQGFSELAILGWWSSIMLGFQICVLIYTVYVTRKSINNFISIKYLGKYLIGSVGISTIYYFTSPQVILYKNKILDFLPGIVTELLICVSAYLLITYLIDNSTRALFQNILKELFRKKL